MVLKYAKIMLEATVLQMTGNARSPCTCIIIIVYVCMHFCYHNIAEMGLRGGGGKSDKKVELINILYSVHLFN